MSEEWREQANCRGKDVNMFFIEKGPTAIANMKAVREICNACIIKKQCLDYALDNSIKDGIYGGQAPKERRISKRKREKGMKYV